MSEGKSLAPSLNAPSRFPRSFPTGAERGLLFEMRSARGSFELFSPTDSVLVSRATGHLEAAMTERWVRRTAHLWVSPRPLAVFNDWELMTSYDTDSRRTLTSWVIDHHARIDGLWFLLGSKLVAMGVAAAGVATALVGITLHVMPERPRWNALLSSKLAQ